MSFKIGDKVECLVDLPSIHRLKGAQFEVDIVGLYRDKDVITLKGIGGHSFYVTLFKQVLPMTLKFKKLVPEALLPTRAHSSDAGLDLYSLSECTIVKAGEGFKFSTGVACNIPEQHYLQIHTRSSMAKAGWVVVGGVCDSGYKGELFVMLRNITNTPLAVHPGDRIAQAILHPAVICPVEEVDDIGESDRGVKGYGSSGQ